MVGSNRLRFANIFKSLLLYGENVQLASYAYSADISFSKFIPSISELEFLNNLWGLGTEYE